MGGDTMTIGTVGGFENSFVGGFLNLASTANEALVSFTGTTGIAGFVFDIKDTEEISLESDITDHYTESNVPVQDNIINKPVRVTLRGTVGEHVYTPPKKESTWDSITGGVQKITEKLSIVGSYLPAITSFSKQAYSELTSGNGFSMDSLMNLGSAAFDLYHSINVPADNQSHAFMFFEALWQSRQTFSIQTPYRYYSNMAIESLKAVQTGESTDTTEFEIRFKEIRKVISNVPEGEKEKSLFGRLAEQASEFDKNYLGGFFGNISSSVSSAAEGAKNSIMEMWGS